MKRSRKSVRRKTTVIPTLRFEDQSLTSCSGLVVFQALFARLRLSEHLGRCLRSSSSSGIYGLGVMIRLLLVHLLLGYRELRDCRFYEDDVLVKRLLGLSQLPDISTISRELSRATQKDADKLRRFVRELVLDRLEVQAPARLTLDFDGSVQSTKRYAEGTAVGFNKKKKGARSYYPLFCTISQTGQVFDVFHRSGNVHDSNGAKQFILACLEAIRERLPFTKIEVRVDSAFFSDEIVTLLHEQGIEFTISVPFERFVQLKDMIEARRRWKRHDDETSFFETPWKPGKWNRRFRFVFVRMKTKRQRKDPVQFDLFVPYSIGYDFKVIVTNKSTRMKHVMAFHNGRGSQEGIFAELKSQAAMDYVPSRRVVGNQIYRLCAILAHNLTRELQMTTKKATRGTTENRAAWWRFETLQTLRRNILCRAGRLTRPRGELTLTMNANNEAQSQIEGYLAGLEEVA